MDDDANVLRVHVRALSKHHQVTASLDAEDLMASLRAGHSYDVVVSDVEMPGMSGKQLLDALRSEFPSYESKLIFVTGGADSKILESLGTKAIILWKPVPVTELLEAVQNVNGS